MTNNQDLYDYEAHFGAEAAERLRKGLLNLHQTLSNPETRKAFLEERAASKFQVDRENFALNRAQAEARQDYAHFRYR